MASMSWRVSYGFHQGRCATLHKAHAVAHELARPTGRQQMHMQQQKQHTKSLLHSYLITRINGSACHQQRIHRRDASLSTDHVQSRP